MDKEKTIRGYLFEGLVVVVVWLESFDCHKCAIEYLATASKLGGQLAHFVTSFDSN